MFDQPCNVEMHRLIWVLELVGMVIPAASTAAQVVNTLLQLFAWRSSSQWQDLVTKQIIVHAGQSTTKGIQMVFHHHRHFGVSMLWGPPPRTAGESTSMFGRN